MTDGRLHVSRVASLVTAALLAASTGCAPRDLPAVVIWAARRAQVRNAAYLADTAMPALRFDAAAVDRLDSVEQQREVEDARAGLVDVVEAARRLGEYANNNEIDRLDDEDLRSIWRHYAADKPAPADLRSAVRERFWTDADRRLAEFRRNVDAAADAADVHRLARQLASGIEASPKDRHGRGLMLAMVAASIDEPTGPLDRGGPGVDVYEPDLNFTCLARRSPPADDATDALLAMFAPVIVQERVDQQAGERAATCPSCAGAAFGGGTPSEYTYDPEFDRIGTVRLSAVGDVVIDTQEPTVYAYGGHTWINGQRHVQLTYTYWFPAHPKLKRFDPEKGSIEGATLRVTLDQNSRPMLIETVLCCGCYHRCYPAAHVEQAACAQYGEPAEGKTLCIERDVAGRMDWIVPETVDVPSNHPGHPILFSRAGFHGPAGVTFDASELDSRTVLARRAYGLHCYDELEQLPIGGAEAADAAGDTPHGGIGSMFEPNGLVRGAGRLEGKLLVGTGMLSAGQPRQRGTQLLHWDQYDFDDPHLLERCLRLPDGY